MDISRTARIVSQRATQQLHPLRNGLRIDDETRPDLIEQLVGGDQRRRGLHQYPEEVKRQFRERNLYILTRHPRECGIDDQVADP